MRHATLFLFSLLIVAGGYTQTVNDPGIAGKTKLDFREIPTFWISDSSKTIDSLSFISITEKEYLNFRAKRKGKIKIDTTIQPDSSGLFIVQTKKSYYELINAESYSSSYNYIGYIPTIKAHLINHCGEGACESYLLDNEADVKMVVPCDFDAGAIDLLISPSNTLMLVYSSYDGPDYANYYSFRSEFVIYQISKDGGIQELKLFKAFQTGDWSIQEIVWINDDMIALKIYEGNNSGNGPVGGYKYLKTTIK